jgi:hypothetical protein
MKDALALAIVATVVFSVCAVEVWRYRHPTGRLPAWLALIAGLLAGLFLIAAVNYAHGRDLGQWDTTSQQIREWYQHLMQPDNPAVSCCGEADAYWADGFEVDGDRYVAIITDTRPDEPLRRPHIPVGKRIVVPNHKLKYDQSNPTGHGIIFLAHSDSGDHVYCYVAPGGV